MINNVGISPFRFIVPTEPEKIVPLNTKNWKTEKVENYWENEKKFGKVIEI